MSEPISKDIFDHMVSLAALELEPEEAEYLRKQLNNQLQAIHELEQIPLDNKTPITSHGVPYTDSISQVPRIDEWMSEDVADEILKQAPSVDDRYIIVPDIPHVDLS